MQDWMAALFLSACGLAWISYLAYQICHRGRYSLWEFMLYSFAFAVCRSLWRVSVHTDGRASEALRSGAVLVSNHRCSVDPFFIQMAAGRRVHWMVAGEYCRHPLFGPILRLFQVIPTNRGGVDTASTKLAIQFVKQGKWVGMFPEGRLNRTPAPLLTIRPGAGMVATRGQVPLVPIWIEGAPLSPTVWGPLFIPARVRVWVGAPIYASTNQDESETFRTFLAAAMREACAMGGRSATDVQFAGKKWVDG